MQRFNLLIRIVVTLLIGVGLILFRTTPVQAGLLSSRSLRLSSSTPNVVTSHTFNFTVPSATSVGSIEFEYCTNNPFVGTSCTAPSGLNISGATLAQQSGETGFTIHAATTANKAVLTRAPVVTTAGAVSYQFAGVSNASTPGQTIYVRLATFASTDGTGIRTDSGGLAISMNGSFGVSAFVPPYLKFCVGITVSMDCAVTSGTYIDLGTLSPTATSASASQMAASTNDETGYVITGYGTTMTSGNNTIPELAVPTASALGQSQFGINLRANTNPNIGQEPQGTGSGVPAATYNQQNLYRYVSGTVLASTGLPTEPNIFTVSYIINVNESQPPGVYSTTLTYIATAQF